MPALLRRTDLGFLLRWLILAVAFFTVLVTLIQSSSAMLHGHGHDFLQRRQEVQYFLLGVDPNMLHGRVEAELERTADVDVAHDRAGVMSELSNAVRVWPIGVYPPWAYPMSVPLALGRSDDVAKRMYLLVNLCCLSLALIWLRLRMLSVPPALADPLFSAATGPARRDSGEGASVPRGMPVALLLAFASTDAVRSTLLSGNYGLILLALLCAMFEALRRERPAVAGVLLGLALLKPTFSAPFALVLLLQRRWWPGLFSATATVAAATAAFAWHTGVDPLESLIATQGHAKEFIGAAGGWMWSVWRLQSTIPHAYVIWAVAVLAALVVALFVLRDAALLTRFSVCAVAALLWSYHRRYDQTLLLFPILGLALGACTAVSGRTIAWQGTAAVLLIAIWLTAALPRDWLRYQDTKDLIEILWAAVAVFFVVEHRFRRGL